MVGWLRTCVLLWLTASVVRAPAPPPADVAGVVLDAAGQPVAGADLMLLSRATPDNPVCDRGQSDQAGKFLFRGEWFGWRRADTASFYVVALHPKLGFGWVSVGQYEPAVRLWLRPAGELRVQVRDLGRQPLAGIALRLRDLAADDETGWPFRLPAEPEFTAVSDAAGWCRFAQVPRGHVCHFGLDNAAYAVPDDARDARATNEAASTTVAPLTLRRGSVVTGRVVGDPDGAPVAGVNVSAVTLAAHSGYSATTDAQGQYCLRRVLPGQLRIALDFWGEAGHKWLPGPFVDLTLPEGGAVACPEIRLHQGPSLRVSVVAADTGEPVAGVIVSTFGEHRSGHVETDADGQARLCVPVGKQRLDCDIQKVREMFLRPPAVEVTVGADKPPAPVIVRLRRLPVPTPLRGRVLRPDGRPAAGAQVAAVPLEPAESSTFCAGDRTFVHTTTDATGGFSLEDRELVGSAEVRACLGTQGTAQPVLVKPGQVAELRLTGLALGTVALTVVDDDARPLPNARVTLLAWHGEHTLSVAWAAATTDAAGQVLFESCWPGEAYSCRATARGHGTQQTMRFALLPGQVVRPPALMLPAARAWVAGIVRDVNGKPAAGVAVTTSTSPRPAAVTDDNGHFRLEGLLPGEVRLIAMSVAREQAAATSQTGRDDVEMVVK